jgi:hypothetical protein
MPNIVELPCRTESSLINAILRPLMPPAAFTSSMAILKPCMSGVS